LPDAPHAFTLVRMLAPRGVFAVVLVALGVAAANSSCGSSTAADTCQSTCDKVSGCGLQAKTFNCAGDCGENGCAYCINSTACADLQTGKCGAVCVGVTFVKK
jgi:hypothetical protein